MTQPPGHLVLQTVYPVAAAPTEWKFDRTPAEINRGIAVLNGLLPGIAVSEGACLADTAAVLRGPDGFLRAEYSADGIHLTRAGYEAVLNALDAALAEAGL